MEEELRGLSSRLLTAHEEERKRLAGELHDSIGGSLGAIKMSLENALNRMRQGDALAPESIGNMVQMMQRTIEEARRIYMDLRPAMLDDLGILATIGWFTRIRQEIYPHIRIDKQIDVAEEDIPESLKIVIFRVIQEAFHNIVKYSKADLVRLYLLKKDGSLELIISDNGVGFDLLSVSAGRDSKGGLGLTSMRERVELSRGTFSIESLMGEGTTIQAEWSESG
jgi:signal transduction histidine kinase